MTAHHRALCLSIAGLLSLGSSYIAAWQHDAVNAALCFWFSCMVMRLSEQNRRS